MKAEEYKRIELSATQYATLWPVHLHRIANDSYMKGATSENERLSAEIEKYRAIIKELQNEYGIGYDIIL